LLLVEILSKGAANLSEGGRFREGAGEKDGKIAYVDEVFVAEVDEKLRPREPGAREPGVGPVVLLVHRGEEPVGEVARRRALHTARVALDGASVTFSLAVLRTRGWHASCCLETDRGDVALERRRPLVAHVAKLAGAGRKAADGADYPKA
jgi:hypothetical protein